MKKIVLHIVFIHLAINLYAQRYMLFIFKNNIPLNYDIPLQLMAQRADSLYYAGLYSESVQLYKQLADTLKNDYKIYYNLAVSCAETGNASAALMYLQKYTNLAGENCHCSFIENQLAFKKLEESKQFKVIIKQCIGLKKQQADSGVYTNWLLEDKLQYHLGLDQEILNNPRYLNGANQDEKFNLLKNSLKQVINLIDTTYLPDKTIIGQSGTGAVYVLFLHADYWPAMQVSIGNKMLVLAKKGNTGYGAANAAYMIDRGLANWGKPQLYGTWKESDAGGNSRLYPVDDMGKVNQRRRELGMQPLDDYLKNNIINK